MTPLQIVESLHQHPKLAVGTYERKCGFLDALEILKGLFKNYKNEDQPNVLTRANDIVQQRGKSYGHPYEDFSKTAKMWSALLGIEVTPDQVAKCMICVKLSRLSATPQHQDSVDDIAGYTWCLDEVLKVMRGVDITV